MSNTNMKHKNFITERMREKSVKELPGIDDAVGKQLEELGYDKAYTVLGQYLILKKDQERFEEWLKNKTEANAKQSSDCCNGLHGWCNEFL